MILRLGGQVRLVGLGGMAGGAICTGWDLSVAFSMAAALDVPAAVVAELVADVEPVVMAAMNQRLGGGA